jgi:hemerythrin-like domain-containing protein/FMN phosphatase YigB (HAD superfamily)
MKTEKSKHARVVFFDIRNTLGVVDRKGHLVKFQPSTDYLLRMVKDVIGATIGVITNVPPGVDAKKMLEDAGILPFIDPKGIISTQDADVIAAAAQKPQAKIYEVAAARMGVPISDCLYVGENLVEQIGAWAAGMAMGHKAFPPGGDFMRERIPLGAVTDQASGRLAELLLEEEHYVGKRIVMAAVKLKEQLSAGEKLESLVSPMTRLVWLTKSFIDPFHHRKEEEVLIPFGLMHGLRPDEVAWVAQEHEQGRAYFRAMDAVVIRVQSGNLKAAGELVPLLGAFADLYREHGKREDDELFKRIGDLLTDADDTLVVGLMQRIGPPPWNWNSESSFNARTP